MSFIFEMRSTDKQLFLGEILSLTVRALDGELCVLPYHANLISQTNPGEIRYQLTDGRVEKKLTNQGFLLVKDNKATLLFN